MSISRKKNKDTTTLSLSGELTIYTVSQIKQELFAECDSLGSKVALDLQELGEIDTAGVQLLLFAKKFFNRLGKVVFVTKTNEVVDGVFSLLDVNAYFAKEL